MIVIHGHHKHTTDAVCCNVAHVTLIKQWAGELLLQTYVGSVVRDHSTLGIFVHES